MLFHKHNIHLSRVATFAYVYTRSHTCTCTHMYVYTSHTQGVHFQRSCYYYYYDYYYYD